MKYVSPSAADLVHLHDVRVIEVANDVGLAREHRDVLGVALQLGQQPLERELLALRGPRARAP